jgi:stage III sporulation protein AA
LIRSRSNRECGCVAVVDERGEIFPYVHDQFCYFPGKQTDVLTGYKKAKGIDAVLRSMNPVVIAVDEITAEEDCRALLHAGWCGVKLLATAHAGNRHDLYCRPVYRPILESKLFDMLLIMSPDKSWRAERIQI